MASAYLSNRGQITIPAEIRRQMDLHPQDQVVFTVLPNGTTVMRAKKRDIKELAGSVRSQSRKTVGVDSMRLD